VGFRSLEHQSPIFCLFSAAFVLTFLMNLLMLREYVAVFADFIVLPVHFFPFFAGAAGCLSNDLLKCGGMFSAFTWLLNSNTWHLISGQQLHFLIYLLKRNQVKVNFHAINRLLGDLRKKSSPITHSVVFPAM